MPRNGDRQAVAADVLKLIRDTVNAPAATHRDGEAASTLARQTLDPDPKRPPKRDYKRAPKIAP